MQASLAEQLIVMNGADFIQTFSQRVGGVGQRLKASIQLHVGGFQCFSIDNNVMIAGTRKFQQKRVTRKIWIPESLSQDQINKETNI